MADWEALFCLDLLRIAYWPSRLGEGEECWWRVEVKSSVTGVKKADGRLWLIESHGARGSSPTPRAPEFHPKRGNEGEEEGEEEEVGTGPCWGRGRAWQERCGSFSAGAGTKTDDGVEEK